MTTFGLSYYVVAWLPVLERQFTNQEMALYSSIPYLRCPASSFSPVVERLADQTRSRRKTREEKLYCRRFGDSLFDSSGGLCDG